MDVFEFERGVGKCVGRGNERNAGKRSERGFHVNTSCGGIDEGRVDFECDKSHEQQQRVCGRVYTAQRYWANGAELE